MTRPAQRIALLGASGIGRVHYRILHSLGASIPVILGSTRESAERTARELSKEYGTQTRAAWSIEDVFDDDLNGVSICTPPEHHLPQIHACLDHGVAVFCEKPLFWSKDMNAHNASEALDTLTEKAQGRLMVNTSNTLFARTAVTRFGAATNPRQFSFRFDTLGRNQGKDIAMDLLPHALSLLLELCEDAEIADLRYDISRHNVAIHFNYGACQVHFDFTEDPAGARFLGFKINDQSFSRIQEGSGATYRVSLQRDHDKDRIVMQDPFTSYLSSFLDLSSGAVTPEDNRLNQDSLNIILMATCLDAMSTSENDSFHKRI